MANLYQLDKFPTEIHHEYNLDSASHLDYQQIQSFRQLESNTSDRGRMPHTLTPMTPPFTSMDWTNSYESPEAELELPMNEWNETQIHFSHDWGEMESAYSELNLGTAQAEVCSPSELFWPLGNLQGDSTFDNFSFQTALPESCYLTPALQASWYYPNPVPSTPSGNSDQNNSYYEPNGIPDTSSAIAQTPPKANYICETCGRICLKQHLLKYVHYIHL
jgi:hypothetical protein